MREPPGIISERSCPNASCSPLMASVRHARLFVGVGIVEGRQPFAYTAARIVIGLRDRMCSSALVDVVQISSTSSWLTDSDAYKCRSGWQTRPHCVPPLSCPAKRIYSAVDNSFDERAGYDHLIRERSRVLRRSSRGSSRVCSGSPDGGRGVSPDPSPTLS